jgi:hypothetical protein
VVSFAALKDAPSLYSASIIHGIMSPLALALRDAPSLHTRSASLCPVARQWRNLSLNIAGNSCDSLRHGLPGACGTVYERRRHTADGEGRHKALVALERELFVCVESLKVDSLRDLFV